MSVVITVLSLIVALSILVFIHEFGHLIVAKRTGVVVEEFAIGYPPRLLTLWRSAGQIIIAGKKIVIPRRFTLPEGLRARSLVTYDTATDDKGRKVLASIQEADPDSPAAASQVDLVDPGTLYTVNAVPFGGFARMLGEEDPTFPGSLASKGKLVRIAVLAGGAVMNLLVAILFFAFAFGIGGPVEADPPNALISQVVAGTPAEAAGLQAGDIVVMVDSTPVETPEGLITYIDSHLGQEVVLTVERDGQTQKIAVVPRVNPPEGQGAIGLVLGSRTVIKRYPWYEALWQGARYTVYLTVYVITVPVQLIQGLIPTDLARPVGPVGVGRLVGDAVQYSLDTGWWFPVMQMMGALSVALAVTNLLPLPGLDGGRILFVLVEAIRGRRVDPAKEGVIHLIGMALLVALMLLITWQDIFNPLPSVNWGGF